MKRRLQPAGTLKNPKAAAGQAPEKKADKAEHAIIKERIISELKAPKKQNRDKKIG